jgi:hypothetical protein
MLEFAKWLSVTSLDRTVKQLTIVRHPLTLRLLPGATLQLESLR